MPIASRAPHYVRVARALALLTGLTGLSACGGEDSPTPPVDSGVDSGAVADSGQDTDAGGDADAGGEADAGPLADAGGDVDAGQMADAGVENDAGGDRCATCACDFMAPGADGGAASCEALGFFECCPAVGPLFPPDLPA